MTKKTVTLVLHGNAEEALWVTEISKEAGATSRKSACTLFIFNKNSYSSSVFDNTLKIAKTHFKSIIYLYQNPVHSEVLERHGFSLVLQDSARNNEHKNFKYKIFLLKES